MYLCGLGLGDDFRGERVAGQGSMGSGERRGEMVPLCVTREAGMARQELWS